MRTSVTVEAAVAAEAESAGKTANKRDAQENTALTAQHAWAVAANVPDPEIPCVTVADLGILRQVTLGDNGEAIAQVTPTYSGCPAVQRIESDIAEALTAAGFTAVIERVMSPAWTTDWISDEGREKLKQYGIAPPACVQTDTKTVTFFSQTQAQCPRCDSTQTRRISEFGSTACKAQYQCNHCLEPFDFFKPF